MYLERIGRLALATLMMMAFFGIIVGVMWLTEVHMRATRVMVQPYAEKHFNLD